MLEINVKDRKKLQIVRDFEPVEVWISNDPNLMLKLARKEFDRYFRDKFKGLINFCSDWGIIDTVDFLYLEVAAESSFFEISRDLDGLLKALKHSNIEVDAQLYNINQTIEAYDKFMADFEKMHVKKEASPAEKKQLILAF